MIDGGSYQSIYLIIISIYTIILSDKYSRYPDSRLRDKQWSSPIPALALTAFLIIFIGFRPLHSSFTDMWNYTTLFDLHKYSTFMFNFDASNLIFDNLFIYLATHNYEIEVFFLLMAAIYFGGVYVAARKMFPSDTLYGVVIYLAAFSTFSYGVNGIKAGAAASIFLCALAFGKNKVISALLMLVSLGFHHSMVLPIGAAAICYFYNNPKRYLYFWGFCLICAVVHLTFFQNLFGGMVTENGAGYLIVSEEGQQYVHGFRIDFIIYSVFPILIGYYAIFKQEYKSWFYNWIYSTYTLTNGIWMLCMYASFTNRIAYLSWLMIPFVLIYPFFDKQFVQDQYKKLNIVACSHLGFTVLMEVVYYGIFRQ